MSANAYEAQVPLQLGDRELTLQIDYRAVGALMSHLGEKDWTTAISEALNDYDMDKVATIVEIAAKRNHPDITAKEIYDASPPFQRVVTAIGAAVQLFLWGDPKALEGLDLGEPTADDEEEASGEPPLANGKTRWRDRGARLLKLGYHRQSFG